MTQPILFIFKFYVHTFSMYLYFHFSIQSKWVPVCFSNERIIGTLAKSFQFPFMLHYIERDPYQPHGHHFTDGGTYSRMRSDLL